MVKGASEEEVALAQKSYGEYLIIFDSSKTSHNIVAKRPLFYFFK